MSEENIKSPSTPKATKPDESSPTPERCFTAESSSTKKGNVVSRYLRPSTGSCHDQCKYGKKQETEAKARRPLKSRITSKPLRGDDQNSLEIEIFLPGKKSSKVELNTSFQVKGHISDWEEIVKHEVSAKSPVDAESIKPETNPGQYVVSEEDLSSGKKSARIQVPPSSNSSTHVSHSSDIIKQEIAISPGSQNDGVAEFTAAQNPVDTKVLVGRKKLSGKKFKYSLNHGASASFNKYKAEHSTVSRNSMEDEVLSEENETSVIQQRSGYARPRVRDVGGITKKKSTSSFAKVKASSDQASPRNRGKSVMMNSNPSVVKASSAIDSSGFPNSKKNSEVRIGRRFGTSKAAAKKVLNSSSSSSKVAVRKVSASPAKSSNLAAKKMVPCPNSEAISTGGSSLISRKLSSPSVGSSTKNNKKNKSARPNQPKVEEVEEKTLYVVKMDLAKKYSEVNGNEDYAIEPHSDPSSSSTSSHLNPDVVASHEKIDEEKSEYRTKNNSLSKNTEIFVRGEEAMKRGPKRTPRKASTVTSGERDHKPVKLNFQRGKVLDAYSQSNSPKRLKFRRVRIMGENQNAKVDGHRRSFKSRGEIAHSKNAQGLFNNVIEETASKLVETRKSKVKALVGAFETVISLQESKPVTNAVTGADNGLST